MPILTSQNRVNRQNRLNRRNASGVASTILTIQPNTRFCAPFTAVQALFRHVLYNHILYSSAVSVLVSVRLPTSLVPRPSEVTRGNLVRGPGKIPKIERTNRFHGGT